jgi:hypothetical protein
MFERLCHLYFYKARFETFKQRNTTDLIYLCCVKLMSQLILSCVLVAVTPISTVSILMTQNVHSSEASSPHSEKIFI